jgi:hypothetical protein
VKYVNFDNFLNADWNKIHIDCCEGIARSNIRLVGPGAIAKDPNLPYLRPHMLDDFLDAADPLVKEAALRLPKSQRLGFLTFHSGVFMLPSIIIRDTEAYNKKHLAATVVDHPDAIYFKPLLTWIKSCGVFEEFGRIVIFLALHGGKTRAHRDVDTNKFPCEPFLWLNPSGHKQFHVDDELVTSKSAWFNSHFRHYSDPAIKATYSVRIDGVFTSIAKDYIREQGYNDGQV